MRRPLILLLAGLVVLAVAGPAAAGHRHGPSVRFGWSPWWSPWPAAVWVDRSYPSSGPPELGVVDTDVDPERALVYLDGKLIGTADDFDGFPDYLYLRPGTYALEFRLGGCTTATLDLEVEAGQHYPIDMTLEREPGKRITPWYEEPENLPVGRVFGPKKGAEPEPVRRGADPELRRETRDIERRGEDPELRRETREPVRDVEPRSGDAGAALELRIKPDNASVYVDGELMGTGEELSDLERGLAVSAGKHRIDVLAPGHQPRSFEVDVRAGERQQVVVELPEGLDKEVPRD